MDQRRLVMGKNVTIVIEYGIQGESMIKHALELVHDDDALNILIVDISSEELKYNKEVDFQLIKNRAEELNCTLDIIESSPKHAFEKAVQYAQKKKTDHLIIGEDREQLMDLILQGSLSSYILSKMPETYLSFVPFNLAVDNDFFEYASGKRVFLKKIDGAYRIVDNINNDYDYEAVYYKSNYTDFETGVIYIYVGNRLIERKITEGIVEDF